MPQPVTVLDTTLRDGAQREGISLSAKDKLRIAQKLDELGVAYIAGGGPGSNPKDIEFFERARDLEFRHARLAAFGSPRRANSAVEADANVRALLGAGTPVAVVVGKSSAMQVAEILRTTLDENLAMIRDTVAYLCAQGLEVIFDAEHYFDGHKLDAAYAWDAARRRRGRGQLLLLCDTNGGTLPKEVARVVAEVRAALPRRRWACTPTTTRRSRGQHLDGVRPAAPTSTAP
jgi:2-isopropylmalate synthase